MKPPFKTAFSCRRTRSCGTQGFCLKGPVQIHPDAQSMVWNLREAAVLGAKLSIYSHFLRRPLNSTNQMSQVSLRCARLSQHSPNRTFTFAMKDDLMTSHGGLELQAANQKSWGCFFKSFPSRQLCYLHPEVEQQSLSLARASCGSKSEWNDALGHWPWPFVAPVTRNTRSSSGGLGSF